MRLVEMITNNPLQINAPTLIRECWGPRATQVPNSHIWPLGYRLVIKALYFPQYKNELLAYFCTLDTQLLHTDDYSKQWLKAAVLV